MPWGLGQCAELAHGDPRLARGSDGSNTLTAHPVGPHAGEYGRRSLPSPTHPSEMGSDNSHFPKEQGEGSFSGGMGRGVGEAAAWCSHARGSPEPSPMGLLG